MRSRFNGYHRAALGFVESATSRPIHFPNPTLCVGLEYHGSYPLIVDLNSAMPERVEVENNVTVENLPGVGSLVNPRENLYLGEGLGVV